MMTSLALMQAAAEAKAQKADAERERAAPISVEGAQALCQIRLEYQTYMDDRSNVNGRVWDLIKEAFDKKVDAGDLPESDKRSGAQTSFAWRTNSSATSRVRMLASMLTPDSSPITRTT